MLDTLQSTATLSRAGSIFLITSPSTLKRDVEAMSDRATHRMLTELPTVEPGRRARFPLPVFFNAFDRA